MVPASENSLSSQAIKRWSTFLRTLFGGQNAVEGDNMRFRLRPVPRRIQVNLQHRRFSNDQSH
jgi:hypothetical protein